MLNCKSIAFIVFQSWCFFYIRRRVSTNCYGLVKGYLLGLVGFFLLQLLIVVTINKDTLTTIIGPLLGEEGTLVMKQLIVSGRWYACVLLWEGGSCFVKGLPVLRGLLVHTPPLLKTLSWALFDGAFQYSSRIRVIVVLLFSGVISSLNQREDPLCYILLLCRVLQYRLLEYHVISV